MDGIMDEQTTSDRIRAISLVDPHIFKRHNDYCNIPLKGHFKGNKGMSTALPTVSPDKDYIKVEE
jgi:hypothetical protein